MPPNKALVRDGRFAPAAQRQGVRRAENVVNRQHDFENLFAFIERLPAVRLPAGRKSIGYGRFDNGSWWVKFSLDTKHPLAWRHVQELGYVLNHLSSAERLPTVFMPVAPPPYLNGGVEFLSWVIESTDPSFTPDNCVRWLEGRLPRPVDDLGQWETEDDDDADPGAAPEPASM
jgi:hypothetical protein